ncbi:FtsQ-type POTRA domain-containing protein [Chlorobaculum sp. 24CR]|uniref:cell division protein FtsQ/DivIB n=1 Tax=Chlorobaculum sp. 24CR TaxID=2508878 RepID=UPI00100AEBBE|nr:FtsQ-type POTRA domain-containing protein [Chlorobaculum sp. 24CR]RXK87768.1 FtsQ-type POTRA domain-containing protein [Chlorobaculum sp. 24CR]
MVRPENERWAKEPMTGSGQPEFGEPEPTRPRKGKLRRLFSATPVMMAFAALLLAAVAALSWYATQWKQQVTLNRVVVSGANLIPDSAIERRLKRFKGKNLDEVSLNDVRRALAPEPYIKQMRIGKELNGILRIDIEERRPAALMADEGRNLIIDTEGNLLPDEKVSGRFRLVPVYGARSVGPTRAGGLRQLNDKDKSLLFDLLDAFDKSAYARLMVSGIHLDRDNRTWFSVAGSPIRFVVGNDGNFKEKLKKFEIFWQKVVAKKGIDCYESVDLRFRHRVFATSPVTEAASADSSAAPAAPPAGGQLSDEHH